MDLCLTAPFLFYTAGNTANLYDTVGWWAADGRSVIEGFVEHYVGRPFHPEGMTPALQALVLAAWVVPVPELQDLSPALWDDH